MTEFCQHCGEEPAVVDTEKGWVCDWCAAALDRRDDEQQDWDLASECCS